MFLEQISFYKCFHLEKKLNPSKKKIKILMLKKNHYINYQEILIVFFKAALFSTFLFLKCFYFLGSKSRSVNSNDRRFRKNTNTAVPAGHDPFSKIWPVW